MKWHRKDSFKNRLDDQIVTKNIKNTTHKIKWERQEENIIMNFLSITLEKVAGNISGFVTGVKAGQVVPCEVTFGKARRDNHTLNSISVVFEERKMEYHFYNKEEDSKINEPYTVTVDAVRLSNTIKALCLFKEDLVVEWNKRGISFKNSKAAQTVPALALKLVNYNPKMDLQVQYRVKSRDFVSAMKKASSFGSIDTDFVMMNIDNEGKFYVTGTAGNSALVYTHVPGGCNQGVMTLSCIRQYMNGHVETLVSALKEQNSNLLKDAGMNVVSDTAEFNGIYFAIGGRPAAALLTKDGKVAADINTLIRGTVEKQKLLLETFPGITVEIGDVVKEYFAKYSLLETVAQQDVRMITSLFGGMEKLDINVYAKSVSFCSEGLEIFLPKGAAKGVPLQSIREIVSRQSGPYAKAEDEDIVVEEVLIDNSELQTALTFLQETSTVYRNGEPIPVIISCDGKTATLQAYNEPNGVVQVPLLNEVSECSFCGVAQKIKTALTNSARGTVQLNFDNVCALQITPAKAEDGTVSEEVTVLLKLNPDVYYDSLIKSREAEKKEKK